MFARAGVDRDTYYEHIALALGAGAATAATAPTWSSTTAATW